MGFFSSGNIYPPSQTDQPDTNPGHPTVPQSSQYPSPIFPSRSVTQYSVLPGLHILHWLPQVYDCWMGGKAGHIRNWPIICPGDWEDSLFSLLPNMDSSLCRIILHLHLTWIFRRHPEVCFCIHRTMPAVTSFSRRVLFWLQGSSSWYFILNVRICRVIWFYRTTISHSNRRKWLVGIVNR